MANGLWRLDKQWNSIFHYEWHALGHHHVHTITAAAFAGRGVSPAVFPEVRANSRRAGGEGLSHFPLNNYRSFLVNRGARHIDCKVVWDGQPLPAEWTNSLWELADSLASPFWLVTLPGPSGFLSLPPASASPDLRCCLAQGQIPISTWQREQGKSASGGPSSRLRSRLAAPLPVKPSLLLER